MRVDHDTEFQDQDVIKFRLDRNFDNSTLDSMFYYFQRTDEASPIQLYRFSTPEMDQTLHLPLLLAHRLEVNMLLLETGTCYTSLHLPIRPIFCPIQVEHHGGWSLLSYESDQDRDSST